MQPAAENSAESSIQLHVQIMLGKISAAGSKVHYGFGGNRAADRSISRLPEF
jgi:hypothetical protein